MAANERAAQEGAARADENIVVRDFHTFGDVATAVGQKYAMEERVWFYVHYTMEELSHGEQEEEYPTGWYRCALVRSA